MNWFRWWKDRTFLTILAIAIVAMLVAFVFARYISWGWIVSCLVGLLAGLFIRKVITRKLDEISDGLG